MIANDGDEIVQHDDLAHTRHSLRPTIVDAGDLAAEHRTLDQSRDLDARRSRVDAVLHSTVDLLRRVESLHRTTDQPELRRVFQRDVFRRRDCRRARGQRAVVERALRAIVNHLAIFGAALRCRNLPLTRSGLDQAGTRGRSSLAQRLPESADGIRIAGGLDAQHRIEVQLLVGRRVLDAHPLPVRVEFFCDDHRERRVHALPHLDLRTDERHCALTVDADEGVRCERLGLRRVVGIARGHVEAVHKNGTRRHADEFATSQLDVILPHA
jgi:hypothetical protein